MYIFILSHSLSLFLSYSLVHSIQLNSLFFLLLFYFFSLVLLFFCCFAVICCFSCYY